MIAFAILWSATSTAIFAQHQPLGLGDMEKLSWKSNGPGVWVAQVGDIDAPLLSTFAGALSRLDSVNEELHDEPLPLRTDTIQGLGHAGRATLRLPLSEDERVYGLGLQFSGTDRREEVFHLHVDHFGGIRGRTHAPVPLYISSRGYAVFFDTTRYIDIYAGIGNRRDDPDFPTIRDRNTDPKWDDRPPSNAVEASVQGPGLRVILFAGPTPLAAMQRYVMYFGGGCLPPKWGLGFWHRVPTNATTAQIVEEVDRFATEGFPLDVIGLEPGWQSKAYPGTFDWNAKHFPDPKAFVASMRARGIRVNLWENPYVSPGSTMYKAILPYTGSHTVWLGVVPDYTIEAARHVMQNHHAKTHLDVGVAGYKIDEVDGVDAWLWPDHAAFPSGLTGEQMRQTYGLQLQSTLMEMFRARDQRTYGLVRGTNGASPAYPFALYSDSYDHRQFVSAVGETGLTGVLWAPEIRSAKTAEEWVRRMQSACMSPLAQLNAWSDGTKPWSFPEVNDAIRNAMLLRQRLLPYLYTAFAEYHFRGVPPFRPLVLDESVNTLLTEGAPSNKYRAAIETATDQYLMGDALLVAPAFTGQTSRNVVLPPGNWYDFHTGAYAGNGEVINVATPLETIPLFARDGALVPLGAPNLSLTDETRNRGIEIRHYGEADGSARMYDDDGETYAYERGTFTWHPIEATSANGSWKTDAASLEATTSVRWTFMPVAKAN